MKHSIFFLSLLILVLLTGTSSAAIPNLINYQGMLTNDAGDPLNGNYDLSFSIYSQSSGGSALWSETHTAVSVDKGLFNVILGSTTPVSSSLFDDTTRYLGIAIGADPELSPRARLTSVGYAYRALVADSAVKATSVPTGGGWTDEGTEVRLETSTDKVGIGTADPAVKLHIGNVSDQDALRIGSRGDVFDWTFYQDVAGLGSLRLKDGGGNVRMTWQAGGNGNVGIGTTNPESRLTIETADLFGDEARRMIKIIPGNSQGRVYIESSVDYLDFLKTDASGAIQDYLTLVAGKLGIGADPSYPFHVSKSWNNTYVTCLENLSATGQGLQILTSDTSSGRDALTIFTGGLGGTYKLVVKNNGRVGIGTTSPEAPLHVFGVNSGKLAHFAANSGTYQGYLYIGSPSGTDWRIGKDPTGAASGYFGIANGAGTTQYVTVNTSGDVGIGTTTPSYKLDVEGYVQAQGYYTGDIVFQKEQEKLWRMFEDENGLYLENLKTGKIYRFVLQEVEGK